MDTYYVTIPDVITFPVVGGISIHNILNDEYFMLEDGVSTLVWELLDGSKNVTEITDLVAAKCSINPEEVESDVFDFISSLKESGLIEEAPGSIQGK